MKRAKILAETVVVLCPTCSQPAPASDGGHMWTVEEAGSGSTILCACGEQFAVQLPNRIAHD